MQTKILRGDIGATELADVLLSLHATSGTGRVRLEREGVARDLFLRSGHLVAADSSVSTDSLEWMLFTAGVLSEERHRRARALIEAGARRGPALVESGGVSPAVLCEWTERRARFLARDVLSWRSGTWEFEEGCAPPPGSIGVKLELPEILLAALRERSAAPSVASRIPPSDAVPDPGAGGTGSANRLLPPEAYVLSLADGRRRVSEICSLSELGEAETLRILALLRLAGCFGPGVPDRAAAAENPHAGGAPALLLDLPAGDTPAAMRAAIRIYNELFAFLCAYMIKEVGPIAEQLLEKNLREVRDLHAALFNRALAGRDGTLPEETLLRNVGLIKDRNRRDLLVAGLDDYLRAMVLAVRRILGPDHEGQVLRRMKDLRCTRT